jgi:HAL2 family 3'(2'),5'-bisphosphate nucleotidase
MSQPAPDLDAYLSAARRAVTLAARVTRAVQQSMGPDGLRSGALSKADDSPVTIADFAAQAVVARTLVHALGPIRLVGEESARYLRDPAHAAALAACVEAASPVWPGVRADELLATIDLGAPEIRSGPAGAPGGPDSFWTLDPIDGTKGFIRGHQYSVCLAYIHRGVPVVAALACPNLSPDFERPFEDPDPRGLTFLATADGPARVVPADDETATPKAIERPAAIPGSIRMVGSYTASHSNESMSTRVVRALEASGVRVERPRRVDSQVKYAVVARGQADVFLRTPRSAVYRENIWDHAAGSLIAQRAGCLATDVLGVGLDFGRGLALEGNSGILCGPAGPHGLVVEAVRAVSRG